MTSALGKPRSIQLSYEGIALKTVVCRKEPYLSSRLLNACRLPFYLADEFRMVSMNFGNRPILG